MQRATESGSVILLPLEVGLEDAHQLRSVGDILWLLSLRHGVDDRGELLDFVVLRADLPLQGFEGGRAGLARRLADSVRGKLLQGALEACNLVLLLRQGLLERVVDYLDDLGWRAVGPHATDLVVLVGELLLEEADRVLVPLRVALRLSNRRRVDERAEALELCVLLCQ